MILRQAEGVHELDLPVTDRLKLEHYARILGKGQKLTAREEKILAAVEFGPELTSEEIVARMRDVLANYFGVTGGMLRREAMGKLPLDRVLAASAGRNSPSARGCAPAT